MTILEVIRECVVALFKDELLEKTLVLKGGTALHLVEQLDSRLSTDIDFSACEKIDSPKDYFARIEAALAEHFLGHGFEVFDCKYARKPKEKAAEKPEFWGGWHFEFKLIARGRRTSDIDKKRREALIPEGAPSSRIQIEISEHEYCGHTQRVTIGGSEVVSYTGVLLVAEKIRAICQQHPAYPYGSEKNRARDFYDVYQLVRKYRSPEFFRDLKDELPKVFLAKEVDLSLILRIFEPSFLAFQAGHFSSVDVVASVRKESFDFYAEQLKLLLNDVGLINTLEMF